MPTSRACRLTGPDDEVYFGPSMKEICETRLVKDKEGWYVLVG